MINEFPRILESGHDRTELEILTRHVLAQCRYCQFGHVLAHDALQKYIDVPVLNERER